MEEINLNIDGRNFKVMKSLLCEYSDYFRAMFSGNYVEQAQNDIKIDVVDADSMEIVLRYMEMGFIDLSDHNLPTISKLATIAMYLQVTELIKQIEYCLECDLTVSNCMEVLEIAENCLLRNLEQACVSFALFNFKTMKPEHLPSVHRLFWYLSHPYLDTPSELEIFKFGLKWILQAETGADALVIILSCLDVTKIKEDELDEMISLIIEDYDQNILSAKVLHCIKKLFEIQCPLTSTDITTQKSTITELFSDEIFEEVLSLVTNSKPRKLKYFAAVPIWLLKEGKLEFEPHVMYTYTLDTGLKKWLEVADKNLWGWNVVSWGPHKIVTVCGENGRGTGAFVRNVKVYDVLKKEWICHGVTLPARRHAGAIVLNNLLFIIGGVGTYRVLLETSFVYNLKERSFRSIAKLPEPVQNPAVCLHDEAVYVSGQRNIFRYEDTGCKDAWVLVLRTDMRFNCMTSFKGYIYCTQCYFSNLYRFRPGIDNEIQLVATFSDPPAAICNFGDYFLAFTRPMCTQMNTFAVEEFRGTDDVKRTTHDMSSGTEYRVNDVAGSCMLVMTAPPISSDVSSYHKQYLMRYE